jgi:hypothetical protein
VLLSLVIWVGCLLFGFFWCSSWTQTHPQTNSPIKIIAPNIKCEMFWAWHDWSHISIHPSIHPSLHHKNKCYQLVQINYLISSTQSCQQSIYEERLFVCHVKVSLTNVPHHAFSSLESPQWVRGTLKWFGNV